MSRVPEQANVAKLTQDSMRQYKELGVFTESGGVGAAREA